MRTTAPSARRFTRMGERCDRQPRQRPAVGNETGRPIGAHCNVPTRWWLAGSVRWLAV